jgi:hypothetical protein
MTYREMAAIISKMTEEEKDNDVTVFASLNNEFYGLVNDFPFVQATDECEVLDSGHYYLVI